MNLEDIFSKLGISSTNRHVAPSSYSQISRSPTYTSKVGIRASNSKSRIIVGAGKIPFWKMRGYQLIASDLPGVRTWRGPLVTHYGQVIAEIESAHPGQYSIYIVNLPGHLHGHPCLPKTGKRWQMHLHGAFQGLDHLIFAAERTLEHHWNWQR